MDQDLEGTFLNMLDVLHPKIFRICISYTKNSEEAKDLFQEVLINIWKALPNFKNRSSLSTWVYRITINVSLRYRTNLMKGKAKYKYLGSIEIEHIPAVVQDNSNEKLEFLRACVRNLNEVDKALITLFLEELTYREIAEIMGLKENTVAVKIKRIKTKLLNCIKDKL